MRWPDRTPLTDERSRLAASCVPLAWRLAGPRIASNPRGRDAYLSAAAWGLMRAAELFEPEKGVKFATFAGRWIQIALRDAKREWAVAGFKNRTRSGPAPACVHLSAFESPADLFEAPARDDRDPASEAEASLARLPARLADVLRRVYLDGESKTAVAADLGVNRWEINRRIDEARRILRRSQHHRRIGN